MHRDNAGSVEVADLVPHIAERLYIVISSHNKIALRHYTALKDISRNIPVHYRNAVPKRYSAVDRTAGISHCN